MAIVGSRLASVYGRYVTEKISRELALKGITVVSGLARGIDAAAHRGALAGKGRTIAVLGCGLDVVYPPENEELAQAVAAHGALVTEFPFGTPPNAPNFPSRNRIISGLSLGVVVVEAGEKSGSLITARIAAEQGRSVFAVPGAIEAAGSRGTNRLIKQGAKLIENVEDILEEILPQAAMPPAVRRMPSRHPSAGWAPARSGIIDSSPARREIAGLGDPEQKLLLLIPHDPVGIDQLITASGLTAQEVLNSLLVLELGGFIRQLPGKHVYSQGVIELKSLIVVESPTKVKTIRKYLGEEYDVRASVGHVKDLPKNSLGIDPEKGFEPTYVVMDSKKKVIAELKKAAAGVQQILLAPDPDREGEAIAWHIADEIGGKGRTIRRVLFNDLTRETILDAIAHPHDLDFNRYEAQQTRRILDRLVGYQISPAPLGQGETRPFRRPRPVRRRQDHLRPGSGDQGVRPRGILEPHRPARRVEPAPLRGETDEDRRKEGEGRQWRPLRRSRGRPEGRPLHRLRRGEEGGQTPAARPLHDEQTPAGGLPLAAFFGKKNHVDRPETLRGDRAGSGGSRRAHHLHEDRLRPHRRRGHQRGAGVYPEQLRSGLSAPESHGSSRSPGPPRTPTRRSGRHRWPIRPRRSNSSSPPTSSASTSSSGTASLPAR